MKSIEAIVKSYFSLSERYGPPRRLHQRAALDDPSCVSKPSLANTATWWVSTAKIGESFQRHYLVSHLDIHLLDGSLTLMICNMLTEWFM